MNRKFIFTLCVIVAIAACRKDRSEIVPAQSSAATTTTSSHNPHNAAKTTDDSTIGSLFITKSVANQMISSYVSSIGTVNATSCGINDLKSFSIDADSLREYLSDPKIKNIKLVFGHTMKYINGGHTGQFSGMQSGALTIIVAGYDSNGNYIYHGSDMVLDHAMPCPYSCGNGQASLDLLP